MPWIDSRIWIAGLGLSLLGMASAASAEVLVVRAIGPSAARYKPGTVLPDSATIALKPGDTLTLLDAQGSWTLRGPVATVANVRARNAATAPRIMTVNSRRARVGAVRSVEGGEDRPNLWLVDVAAPGAMCIVDPANPVLWRFDAKPAGTMTIEGPGGATAQIEWAAGQDTHAWPETLPVVADASYRLTGVGDAKPVTLTFKPIATAPASVAETGKTLIERGCSAQLDLLVAQTAPPEGS